MKDIAVIGSGYWGKNLIRVFWELGALHTICDVDGKKLEVFKNKYPDITTVLSYKGLLEDENISAVVIATPAVYHYKMAKEALLSNKDVFVEKPLSLEVREGGELAALAREKGRVLMVGHILQYHPAVIKLRELINKGDLGKIQYIYSNRLNIGKIRSEENILWSFAPHDISVILMLLGEMPETVYATGGSYLQQQIPDTTLTTLDFPSGVKAHIFVSWLHPFKEQKLVVVGDKKMAVFDDTSEEKLMLYSHKIQWLQRIPVASKADAEKVAVDMEEPLKAECQHFLECIKKGLTARTDGWEGLRVLQVLQSSQQSLNQNSCKITLAQVAGHAPVEPLGSLVRFSENRPRQKPLNLEPSALSYFVHESSYIDDSVKIGAGTKIWHFSHILTGSRIGQNCTIGQNVVIGPDVTIGNGCKIQDNVSLYKGVTLEDEVFCGPSMVFTNVYNPRAHIRRMDELRLTLVKKGATLGANCTIVCGHIIGRYAFVGAGAVVTKDVPDYALIAGNPARQKGWICCCGNKIIFNGNEGVCQVCGRKYEKLETESIKEL